MFDRGAGRTARSIEIDGEAIMLQLSSGIIGGLSVALTFGAIQFASGRDLTGFGASDTTLASSVVPSVNRSAKSDRELVRGTQTPGRTLAVRLESLPDTSILVRVQESRTRQIADDRPIAASPPVQLSKPPVTSGRKFAGGCEPAVSLLTEVAKQLPPGRCLT